MQIEDNSLCFVNFFSTNEKLWKRDLCYMRTSQAPELNWPKISEWNRSDLMKSFSEKINKWKIPKNCYMQMSMYACAPKIYK